MNDLKIMLIEISKRIKCLQMNLIKVVPIFHRAIIRKNRMIQKQTYSSIDRSKELR